MKLSKFLNRRTDLQPTPGLERNAELNSKLDHLQLGLLNIYDCITLCDITDYTFVNLAATPLLEAISQKCHYNTAELRQFVAGSLIKKQFRKEFLAFTDYNTIAERLKGHKVIRFDLQMAQGGWRRYSYMPCEYDEAGNLKSVIFTLEGIDEEQEQKQILEHAASYDYMTGIRNRYSGEREIAKRLAEKKSGYFGMVDIDKFKEINDKYGHATGDRLLTEVAALFHPLNDNAVSCRLGGDEFCVFYEAEQFDIIRFEKFVEIYFQKIDNISILEIDQEKLSLSMGVVYYDGKYPTTFDELYHEADKLLYESKDYLGNHAEVKTMAQIRNELGDASETFQDERSRMMATQPVGKLLWKFAAPSIVAMSASSIYNLCDSIFIGRGAGEFAIAGLAITFPIMNILSAFGALTSVGGAAQTSVHMGMRDRKTAQLIFGNVLSMALILSILLSVGGLLFLDPMLTLFGASAETLPYAHDYMFIILLGTVISHTFLGMCGQMRATGNPGKAMRAQLIAVVANLILDPIFIFMLGWGIRGAAFATVCGQLIAWMYAVHQFFGPHHYVYLSKKVLALQSHIVKKIISIGLAPFLVNVSGCAIVVAINHALLSQGGADGDLYVGGYGITNRITQLLVMGVAGFAQGMQPIVGFNIGSGNLSRVKEVLYKAIFVATLVMTTGYALIALFPAQLAAMFTDNQKMIDLCVPALRIALCTFPFVGSQMIAVSFFQSIRKATMSIYVSLTRQLLFLLPMLLILPNVLGVNGVWWSMSLADIFSVTLSWALLWYQLKHLKKAEN